MAMIKEIEMVKLLLLSGLVVGSFGLGGCKTVSQDPNDMVAVLPDPKKSEDLHCDRFLKEQPKCKSPKDCGYVPNGKCQIWAVHKKVLPEIERCVETQFAEESEPAICELKEPKTDPQCIKGECQLPAIVN